MTLSGRFLLRTHSLKGGKWHVNMSVSEPILMSALSYLVLGWLMVSSDATVSQIPSSVLHKVHLEKKNNTD